MVGVARRGQAFHERRTGETSPKRTALSRWPNRYVVTVPPKAHLIAGFDLEGVTKLLRDHDLALRTYPMCHTSEYNSCGSRLNPWTTD